MSAARVMGALCFAIAVLLLPACESTPPLSPTQWNAIETRSVQAPRDEVLRAAAAVILDQGYYFTASDQGAGTMTAARVPLAYQDQYRRTGGMRSSAPVDTIAVWVSQISPAESSMRIQLRESGEHIASDERVSAF